MLLLETGYYLERSICSFSTALSYRCSNSSYVKNVTKYIINFQFYCHWYIHISSISNHHTLWDLQNIQSERENKRTRKDSHSWGLRSHHNQWRKKKPFGAWAFTFIVQKLCEPKWSEKNAMNELPNAICLSNAVFIWPICVTSTK